MKVINTDKPIEFAESLQTQANQALAKAGEKTTLLIGKRRFVPMVAVEYVTDHWEAVSNSPDSRIAERQEIIVQKALSTR